MSANGGLGGGRLMKTATVATEAPRGLSADAGPSGGPDPRLESSQIFRGRFASPAIGAQLERHLLAFIKPLQATPFIMRRPSLSVVDKRLSIFATVLALLPK